MRNRIVTLFVILILGGISATQVHGQSSAENLLDRARKAMQAEQYEQAAQLLDRAADEAPDHAEVRYWLGKLYYDTPLKDVGRASNEINRAIELEPNNVKYLVARLQILRREASNYIVERIRDEKRRRLAHEILSIDSTNAFAHEELGTTYIHDFWRYQNTISLPNLSFETPEHRRGGTVDRTPSSEENPNNPAPGRGGLDQQNAFPSSSFENIDPNEIYATDKFDLKQLKQRGVDVQDLSARADYAYNRAVAHLKEALEQSPRRRSVYDQLMKVYALREDPAQALDMLDEMYVNFPEDPELWQYLGYAHYRTGHLEAAAKSFEKAMDLMAPETRQAFSSLDYFLQGQEQEQYQQDSVRYATRFWTSKDPRYLTTYNERKLEHYARLVYADLLYGAPDLDKRGWETQRGRILVRYGRPDLNVKVAAAFLEDQGDSGTPFNLAGADHLDRNTVLNIWDYGEFRFVFEDPLRNNEYRLYSPPANEIAAGTSLPWRTDYQLKAKEIFREHPERYTYEAGGRRVQLPYLVNTFKREGEEADLYVHYGIPLSQQANPKQTIDLTAQVGSFLVGEQRRMLVERRRTIYGLKPEQVVSFEEARLWTNTQQMEAPPGQHQLSMEFETAGANTYAVQRRDVEVPDYGKEELAISDLLLAYNVEATPDGKPLHPGDIVRQGLSMQPAPWSVFDHEQPIYIYFEGYHFATGEDGQARYEVEAALTPQEEAGRVEKFFKNLVGGGEEGVSVRFEGTSQESEMGQYFIMDAQDEEPGVYTLVVRLHDRVRGETVETQRDLFLE